jgi:hypothetical protein
VAWAALWHRRGQAHWRLGETGAARDCWQTALGIARTAGLGETEAACHASLALCLWAEGDPAGGYVHSSTALNWYRANGRMRSVAQTLYNAALMLEDFGHWRDATILLYEARDTATGAGDREHVFDASIELVHAFVALGRLDEAEDDLGVARSASCGGENPVSLGARRQAELWIAEAHIRLAQRRSAVALRLLRGAHAAAGHTNRPILTRRVAGHLQLSIQAGSGRLKAVAEMTAIISAMSPAPLAQAHSLVRTDGDGESSDPGPAELA